MKQEMMYTFTGTTEPRRKDTTLGFTTQKQKSIGVSH